MQETQYIHVRVKTKARTESILEKNNAYHIHVKEKAEKGHANKKIREILAQTLHCDPKQLRLIKGGRSPSKTFLFNKQKLS